ncbi:hypothetical protein [Nitrososphaera sp. AFS]|uniref:hypothetical protein n=1 Tax=Nitrososphaera sp. AFS TaxID=2301191 RepID=UPI0013922CDA|nr:hypothetical protein [Nitrososphaera sp. AFS]
MISQETIIVLVDRSESNHKKQAKSMKFCRSVNDQEDKRGQTIKTHYGMKYLS